ncbi:MULTISPECIES: hypothetical protein [unclassified Leptolyngbya]|jgi:hypothetical protein|uniref:hypothetical protein n=1 Tax=unclassified Leptolyngbya TaxID=2650499 RepID=UPI0016843235|nr:MULTISPECIES: hypothetical protein [unclassified Leptolyngbya]MBD1910665.1 hypothetical protein [Leptolyngbya sp. FACHB-8]MBD2158412.1 hypothetical protein [Leptolyngbya sp. FACHB-16]
MTEHVKGLVVGALFFLATAAFVHEGVEDRQLSEKAVLTGLAGLGGFGAGYAFGRSL